MMTASAFALYVAPAAGLIFAIGLFLMTARADRKALDRAAAAEQQAAQP